MTQDATTHQNPQEPMEATDSQDAAVTTKTTQDVFDREYVEKLRQEAAKYRTQLRQAQEAAENARKQAELAKLDDVERLNREKLELEQKVDAALEQLKLANIKTKLIGRVTDPEIAMRVLDDDIITDDDVDLDALFARHPILKPPAEQKPVASVGGLNSGQTTATGPLTAADFRGKPPEWVRENLHRLKRK